MKLTDNVLFPEHTVVYICSI